MVLRPSPIAKTKHVVSAGSGDVNRIALAPLPERLVFILAPGHRLDLEPLQVLSADVDVGSSEDLAGGVTRKL
jgi:hypothetical protein